MTMMDDLLSLWFVPIVVQSYTTPEHGILLPYPSHRVYGSMDEAFATQLLLQEKNPSWPLHLFWRNPLPHLSWLSYSEKK